MKSKPELGLNAEEFGAAFQQVWPELSGAEMESVFSKVDATADGLVAWDECLSFMVLHNQACQ